jgi:hypothetical protein
MLRQQRDLECPRVPRDKILGNLIVLTAEIERGTVVRFEEPNYALISQATQTIQRFLDCIGFEERIDPEVQEQVPFLWDDQWLAQWDHDPREFDIDFWQGLGDHSSLTNLPQSN